MYQLLQMLVGYWLDQFIPQTAKYQAWEHTIE